VGLSPPTASKFTVELSDRDGGGTIAAVTLPQAA
jgi:hypothetical protein